MAADCWCTTNDDFARDVFANREIEEGLHASDT